MSKRLGGLFHLIGYWRCWKSLLCRHFDWNHPPIRNTPWSCADVKVTKKIWGCTLELWEIIHFLQLLHLLIELILILYLKCVQGTPQETDGHFCFLDVNFDGLSRSHNSIQRLPRATEELKVIQHKYWVFKFYQRVLCSRNQLKFFGGE